MPKQKPTFTVVFGIIHLAFGVMGVCSAPFALLFLFLPSLPKQVVQNNPSFELMMENESYQIFMMIGAVLSVVGGIVLITLGVGLLKVKPWARTGSIVYAFYAVTHVVIASILNYFLFLEPLVEKLADSPSPQNDFTLMTNYAGMCGGLLFGLVYPICILFFMMNRKRQDAMLDYQNAQ